MTTIKELAEIGERLKHYLSFKKMKVGELGQMSNNQGTQIYNIVKGKKYGVDKFISVVKELPDLNLYWLLFGEGEMLKSARTEPVSESEEQTQLKAEVANLKAMLSYQKMTITAYKQALEIAGSSNEDLKKMMEFYKNKYEEYAQKDSKTA